MGGEDVNLRTLLLSNEQSDQQEDQKAAPTEETFDWLGRPALQSKLGGKKTLPFSLGNICLWYTAYFGIYFNTVLFFGDVLGAGSASAANNTNYWLGSMFLSSVIGAFVAESFLGRLWTCALFQVISLAGLVLTTVATFLLFTGNGTSVVVVFFYVSFYLISVGCGAFQPTLQSLGADQFDIAGDKTFFFTLYLALNNLGIFFGDTIIVYAVQAKGWVFGFSLCAGVGAAALLLFLSGLTRYRQYRHRGNPYTRALQVLIAAARKWRVKAPSDSDALYEDEEGKFAVEGRRVVPHSDSLRWLDRAATMTEQEATEQRDEVKRRSWRRDPWSLSSVTEVEDMKSVLRLVPIWTSSIFFNTVYSQAGTLFVEEGETMDGQLGSITVAAASMNAFNIAAVVLLPLVYSRAIVPVARRFTGAPAGFTALQRVGAGYVVCIMSLCIAAPLETLRLHRARYNASISIFWQVPSFVLLGTAQFLAGIGQLEFYYTYAPLPLRSLGSSFCLTCIAVGDFLSTILVSVAGYAGWISKDLNEGHLDYFFWLLAGLTFLNLAFFTACAKSFNRQYSAISRHLVQIQG